MVSVQIRTVIHGRRLMQMFWLSVVLVGMLFLAPNRVQASCVQGLSESEVVQQIQRYCSVSWRNANLPRADWGDCSQQVFCELLQRVHRRNLGLAISQGETDERRELNRAIWRIIKRQQRSDARAMLPMDWRDSSCSARAQEVDDQLADVFRAGQYALSSRQLCIVQMTAEGHTIAEIASHLGIPATRASDEKYRSIQRMRAIFNAE